MTLSACSHSCLGSHPSAPAADRAAGACVARKGIESSTRLGRHRWVVERTVSWLAGCRRLHRRYELKAEHFLALVGIAVALIAPPTADSPSETMSESRGGSEVIGRAPS
jgi:hypothetical protein